MNVIDATKKSDPNFDAMFGILLGFYLIMVFYQGNAFKLKDQLLTERIYLEFVLAIILLYYINKWDRTGLVAPLITLFGIAWLLKLTGRFDLSKIMGDFASGSRDLFGTIGLSLNNIRK